MLLDLAPEQPPAHEVVQVEEEKIVEPEIKEQVQNDQNLDNQTMNESAHPEPPVVEAQEPEMV